MWGNASLFPPKDTILDTVILCHNFVIFPKAIGTRLDRRHLINDFYSAPGTVPLF